MNDGSLKTPFLHKKPSSLRYFQEGVCPVDLINWKLEIFGEVEKPVTIGYEELLTMPSVDYHRRNVCVCLWSIKRHWKGVLLKDVLAIAGVDITDRSLYIKQNSVGTVNGKYDSTIHLTSAIEREAILAYHVDGEVLPLENGFPLRLIDFGLYLYKCVKCLATLEVTRLNEIGYWEKYAGYSVDGTVLPKKYYAVDIQRKFLFKGTGEVKDADL
ncbi:molybdopterin-dependent oxidoreductase [Rhodoferax antarcticus]|uniref:molybdopterin-dependent oxidoreductase n=1 Tax=Rhodoferax antarcticus TaxID=81479 RepID=UPI0009500E2C|nr:molybdopterin-dependent oxidoreductase [Rhodoferax antarcticus]APW45673.1 hypothetical protein RA876_04025 [Rhodoferax antarcticus]